MTFIAQTRYQYTSSHDGWNDLRRRLQCCARNATICTKLNVWTNLRLCRVNRGEETHNSASVPFSCGRGLTSYKCKTCIRCFVCVKNLPYLFKLQLSHHIIIGVNELQNIRQCSEEHSYMSYTFSIAILNGTCFFRSVKMALAWIRSAGKLNF